MSYNVVFHVDLADEKILNLALSNIQNFYNAPQSQGAEVVLLANGPAVTLFKKECAPAALADVQAKGTKVRLCQNAINKFEVAQEMLADNISIVPAGIIELIDRQNEGFSYIKP